MQVKVHCKCIQIRPGSAAVYSAANSFVMIHFHPWVAVHI